VRVQHPARDTFTAEIKVSDEADAPQADDELASGVLNVVGDLLVELTRKRTA